MCEWCDAEFAWHDLSQLLCNAYTSLNAKLVQLLADLLKYVRMEATIDHLLKDADVMTSILRKFGSKKLMAEHQAKADQVANLQGPSSCWCCSCFC